ncbi:MAG: B12-binding domain-containing radical SAM protein [Desulfobacterales bacterium]|nr:B12-binding domain-containing radical SAM protein [Desulfobacterales bacterium]
MRVVFIYPDAGSQLGFNYGLSHMSAVLKEAGHEVHVIQLCEALEPLPDKGGLQKRVASLAPDVVGFSVVTNQWGYAEKLAGWLRETTDAPLVCGGIHATVAPAEVLASGVFDYVFTGECEDAFLEFVGVLEKGGDTSRIRNLGYLENGEMRLNPVRPFPDLKALPRKDYDAFDFQKIIDAKNGWVGLMASRGCPFKCTYCFNHVLVKKYRAELNCSFRELNYIRHFPVADLIAEIRYLLDTYSRIRMFIFDDDLFTYDANYLQEFCAAYKETCDVPFVVNGHVRFFDRTRARALADAGCRIVKFGLESGSPRVRKTIMRRHMSNEEIKQAIAYAKAEGMHTSCFVMLGLPGETIEDVQATIDLVAEARPGRFRWTFFYPYPGTEAYRISEEGGYIDYDKKETLSNFTDTSCLDFGAEQNLFLSKVGKIMPWFVNARAGFGGSEIYREKVDELLAMDASAWEQREPALAEEERRLSEEMIRRGESHYAVKYNPFMGVISDYFLTEA